MLSFWSMDIPQDSAHHRISVELLKMEYKYQIFDAKEYRKIARHKLLSEHHATLVKVTKIILKLKIDTRKKFFSFL